MNKEIISKKIEKSAIVWFSNTNNYVVLSNEGLEIIQMLHQNISKQEITTYFSKKLEISYDHVYPLVENIANDVYSPNINSNEKKAINNIILDSKISFEITTYYKVNNIIFRVDYQSEEERFLVHPKFAHLEVDFHSTFDTHFEVFSKKEKIILVVDNQMIGSWSKEDTHYFQGKFSMEIVQKIHGKNEDKWLGVFHASAVGYNDNSMLFLGDSGNGKSTSLALLQANGFKCIADDFVPVDAKKQEVFSFPSAISIKKNSVPHLLEIYPELKDKAEHHLKTLNKIVRYLPPNNDDYTAHLPCKALVFIKYVPQSDIQVREISKINAFEKLIPDSWLSPLKSNVVLFLDWFSNLPCYELIYSDNQKMITTVHKLFNDEL